MTQENKEVERIKSDLASLLVEAGIAGKHVKLENKFWDCFTNYGNARARETIDKILALAPGWKDMKTNEVFYDLGVNEYKARIVSMKIKNETP